MTTRWHWLVGVLALAQTACSSDGAPGSRAPIMGSWEDDRATCARTLRARVGGKPGATVTVLGDSVLVGDRGVVEISLPEHRVGDARALRVEIDDGTALRLEQIRVQDPPPWALDRVIDSSAPGDFSGKVHVISGDRRTTYSVRGAIGDDGRLGIPLPCGASGGRADQGVVRAGDSGAELVVPMAEVLLARSSLADSEAVSLSGRLDLRRGTTAEMTVMGTVTTAALLSRYRGATTSPVAWAAPYRKRGHQPILVFLPDRTSFQLVGRAKLRDVAAVAIVTPRYEQIGTCGPYHRPAADPVDSVPHYRTHADVSVFAASTGTPLATVSVEGKGKKCPEALTEAGFDEPVAAHPLPWAKVRGAVRQAAP